jgi:hypothetical protein
MPPRCHVGDVSGFFKSIFGTGRSYRSARAFAKAVIAFAAARFMHSIGSRPAIMQLPINKIDRSPASRAGISIKLMNFIDNLYRTAVVHNGTRLA